MVETNKGGQPLIFRINTFGGYSSALGKAALSYCLSLRAQRCADMSSSDRIGNDCYSQPNCT